MAIDMTYWGTETATEVSTQGTIAEYIIHVSEVVEFIAPKLLPKAWRWYDRFRSWEIPCFTRSAIHVQRVNHRTQERLCIKQRQHQKRRAWLQQLT